jgi:Zn-dependent peptidase ImmA (M78 family)
MAGLQNGELRQSQWQSCKAYILSLSQKARNLVTPERHDTGLFLKGSCHAALMFGTVSPTITQEDVLLLSEKMVEFSQHFFDGEDLIEKRGHQLEIDPDVPPWIQGYELAEQFFSYSDLREALSESVSVDIEKIIKDLNIRIDTIRLSDDGIRAVALAGKGMISSILLNLTNESNNWNSGKRFTLAHELSHLLIDRSYGQKVAIASGPWAPHSIEKRANAFAAMLLMPREKLDKVMGAALLSDVKLSDARKISGIFGVGIRSVIDHLHNCGYLDAYHRQRLHLAADRQAEMGDSL